MGAGLRIVQAAPGSTIQDGGRFGYLRYGVTAAGPMDPVAFATANLALGCDRRAAAIEVGLGGIELEAEGSGVMLAICGGSFDIRLGGARLPCSTVARLDPGVRLSIRAGEAGAWTYVAVAGRIDLPEVLGSLSTHARSGLGGLDGRSLRAGDVVPVTGAIQPDGTRLRLETPWLDPDPAPIRVILGPQDDYFAPEQIQAFLSRDWVVSPRSDRMAYALDGEPLTHAKGHDIVSDGIAHGAIQVPGSGLPFILMADRQPTGGYPKIATVISADLGRAAQIRPGQPVRFQAVSMEAAVAVRRRIEETLARPVVRTPLIRTEFPSEYLLGLNLISGVVDAFDPETWG